MSNRHRNACQARFTSSSVAPARENHKPWRLRVSLAGQVVHGQPDEGALHDGEPALVVLPGGTSGELLVQPLPGPRLGGAVASLSPCSAGRP